MPVAILKCMVTPLHMAQGDGQLTMCSVVGDTSVKQVPIKRFEASLHDVQSPHIGQHYSMLMQANTTTSVPLMALVDHFEMHHAAAWEQNTA